MYNLVTLSDINYLLKGLVMYDSIKKNTSSEFILYYLCLDDETYEEVKNHNDKQLIPLHINQFYEDVDFIKLAKNNKSSVNDFSNFHFALGSYISNYLLNVRKFEHIMYVDSDLYFYEDIKDIFHCVKDHSVGLMLHRHNVYGCHVGCYNVGIIYFKNDETGCNCLEWWKDVVIDNENPYFKTHGHCGDQKYVELFEKLFDKNRIKIIDDDIGHGAPWNFFLYNYLDNNRIFWKGKTQKMYFIHFSHFKENFDEDTYSIDRVGEWNGLTYLLDKFNKPIFLKKEIEKYYNDYFDALKIKNNNDKKN